MLSPTALETKLIASYDAGSDNSLLPTLSPFSQTSRLGYASPSRDGGAFSRSLLSPPRSAGKAAYGGGSNSSGSSSGRVWTSSLPYRLGGHASSSDSLSPSAARLSHSPLSPLPPVGGGGLGMLHLREKVWASPTKSGGGGGGGGGRRDKTGVKSGAQQEGEGVGVGGDAPTPSKSPRSRDWKAAVGDTEPRFFAAAADARDAATAVTPGEVREMAKRSWRSDGDRQSSSPGEDPFESWGRERGGSWGGGGEPRSASATSNDSDRQRQRQRQAQRQTQSSRGGRSSWSCSNDNDSEGEGEGEGHPAAFTPSGGGEHQDRDRDQDQDRDYAPKYLETPRATSHTTPSPAAASRNMTDTDTAADADADDTLLAAASLVSFQKPRAAEAPRLKGPLGTSALRVTLGTPVVSTGATSISSSVQAKLSLPRTTPTPTPAPTPSDSCVQTPADPMETAYRAAGLAVGSGGGAGGGRSQGPDGAGGASAAKSEASLLKSARHGMFDAVSPTAPVEESGTPYSVCRVDRNGRPNGNSTPAAASAEQKKGHGGSGSGDAKAGPLKRGAASGETAAAAGSNHGGGEPLCRTPLKKRAVTGRESGAAATAAPGSAARTPGWSGPGAGPWATPPPMAMGTPCSGSRFRSADDEESDYSDYETVRVHVHRMVSQ